MKKFARIIPALLAASMLAGCSGDNSPAPSEIIITGVTSEAENAVFPVKLADGTMIDHAPEARRVFPRLRPRYSRSWDIPTG